MANSAMHRVNSRMCKGPFTWAFKCRRFTTSPHPARKKKHPRKTYNSKKKKQHQDDHHLIFTSYRAVGTAPPPPSTCRASADPCTAVEHCTRTCTSPKHLATMMHTGTQITNFNPHVRRLQQTTLTHALVPLQVSQGARVHAPRALHSQVRNGRVQGEEHGRKGGRVEDVEWVAAFRAVLFRLDRALARTAWQVQKTVPTRLHPAAGQLCALDHDLQTNHALEPTRVDTVHKRVHFSCCLSKCEGRTAFFFLQQCPG